MPVLAEDASLAVTAAIPPAPAYAGAARVTTGATRSGDCGAAA
jgi:hypothetical protein